MTISNVTVINKMMEQLRFAKDCKEHSEMMNHISKVKLLSELLLEENNRPVEAEQASSPLTHNPTKEVYKEKQVVSNEVDENEGSIFDF